MSAQIVERIIELDGAGQREQLQQYLKAIRYGSEPTRITEQESLVEIETEHFVGTHEKTTTRHGDPKVIETGEYRVKDDRVDVEFKMMSLSDETLALVNEEIEEPSEGTREEQQLDGHFGFGSETEHGSVQWRDGQGNEQGQEIVAENVQAQDQGQKQTADQGPGGGSSPGPISNRWVRGVLRVFSDR